MAAALATFLHDPTNTTIILAIVLVSAGLGSWQEQGAAGAVAQFLALVRVSATVLPDGTPREIPVEEVVAGSMETAFERGGSAQQDWLRADIASQGGRENEPHTSHV